MITTTAFLITPTDLTATVTNTLFNASYTKLTDAEISHFVHYILTSNIGDIRKSKFTINGKEITVTSDIRYAVLDITSDLKEARTILTPVKNTVDEELSSFIRVEVPYPDISIGAIIVLEGVKRRVMKIVSRTDKIATVLVY